MARQPGVAHGVERTDRAFERNRRIRPMDEQKIDIVDAKTSQACVCRALQVAWRDIGVPDLGREKNVAARNTGGCDALPHLDLVFVKRGGVDMPVAKPSASVTSSVHSRPFSVHVPRPSAGMLAPLALTMCMRSPAAFNVRTVHASAVQPAMESASHAS